MELSQLTVHEINGLIEKKEVSVKEVTQAAVDRIDAVEDKVDGYLCLTTETAMKEAEELDGLDVYKRQVKYISLDSTRKSRPFETPEISSRYIFCRLSRMV